MAEKLSFQEWQRTLTGRTVLERDQTVADMLGVTIRCVQNWRYKSTNPRIAIAERLVELSNGQLSVESIIQSTSQKAMRA